MLRLIIVSLLAATSCAPALREQPAALDPAHPHGPKSSFVKRELPAATEVTADSASKGSKAKAFVCPMHPEVQSDHEGVCPECQMKLVPNKAESQPGHHHH